MGKDGKSLLNKKWFIITSLFASVIGVIIGIALDLIQIGQSAKDEPPPIIRRNFEFVLDRSTRMNEHFDNATKLEKAREAVRKTIYELVANNDNLALRQFGGPCEGDNTQITVEFGQNQIEKVRKALNKIKTTGEVTLIRAVTEAIGDFNDIRRFGGVMKKIIVITCGVDSCIQDFSETLQDQVKLTNSYGDTITVDFNLIGLGIPTAQEEQFWKIASITGGDVFLPKSQRALERAIREAVNGKPTDSVVQILTEIFNAVYDSLSSALQFLSQNDPLQVENLVVVARNELKRLDYPLEYLEKIQGNELLKSLLKLATESREIQIRLLDLLKSTIAQYNNGNRNVYKAVLPKWNSLIDIYKPKIIEMNRIRSEL